MDYHSIVLSNRLQWLNNRLFLLLSLSAFSQDVAEFQTSEIWLEM